MKMTFSRKNPNIFNQKNGHRKNNLQLESLGSSNETGERTLFHDL